MLKDISVELITRDEIFSVVFTKNKIEYEAIVHKTYSEGLDYINKKIMNIQQNSREVELNLTDKEIQEILGYC